MGDPIYTDDKHAPNDVKGIDILNNHRRSKGKETKNVLNGMVRLLRD
jgi:hypothetical protein